MQTTGRPSWLNPWNRIGAIRPVSNTIRRQLGAFANSLAIASAVDAACAQLIPSSASERAENTGTRKRRHPEEPPALDSLENTIRKERTFADGVVNGSIQCLHSTVSLKLDRAALEKG